MQSKILLCSLILSLIIFNVLAQDVNNESDGDVDNESDVYFEQYKANLVNAVAILSKSLNTRDARDLQRRGWFDTVWNAVNNAVVKPVVDFHNYYVRPLVELNSLLKGKRTSDDNKALIIEARDLSEAQCAQDVAKFKEAKKAVYKCAP